MIRVPFVGGLAAALAICSVLGVEFEWASPLPHRETWVAMTSGNGRVVGMANYHDYAGRDLYSSEDGKNWRHARLPRINQSFLRLAFGDGLFVLTSGAQDQLLTSTNGVDWVGRNPGTHLVTFGSAAVGHGMLVAAGLNGAMVSSRDLQTWRQTQLSVAPNQRLLEMAFGNGRFMVIGQYGLIWTSTDGETWEKGMWPIEAPPLDWYATSAPLAFSNGLFALSVAPGTFTSRDGLAWKLASSNGFSKLIPARDGFLGINQGIWKSADGSTWRQVFNYPNGDHVAVTCVAELNGSIVAGGTDGLLFHSLENGAWSQSVTAIDRSRPKLAFGNGEFIRYGAVPGLELSKDGSSWEVISNTPPLSSAAFGKGLWVGIKTNGAFATSTDARAWEDAQPAQPRSSNVQFANGLFVAEALASLEADGTNAGLNISRDGRNWRPIEFPGARWAKLIGNTHGRWAAVIEGQRPVTSDDGENWIVHPSQPLIRTAFMAAGNDRFVGISGGGMGPGTASWSFDGVTWQEQRLQSGTTYIEQSLNFGGGLFILTDGVGGVFQSRDALNWTGDREAGYPFYAAAYGAGRWLVGAGDSIIRSVPGSGARLNLSKNPENWQLTLNGSPGESFEIQTAPSLNSAWTPVQILQLPEAGEIQLPVNRKNAATFFRALAAPR